MYPPHMNPQFWGVQNQVNHNMNSQYPGAVQVIEEQVTTTVTKKTVVPNYGVDPPMQQYQCFNQQSQSVQMCQPQPQLPPPQPSVITSTSMQNNLRLPAHPPYELSMQNNTQAAISDHSYNSVNSSVNELKKMCSQFDNGQRLLGNGQKISVRTLEALNSVNKSQITGNTGEEFHSNITGGESELNESEMEEVIRELLESNTALQTAANVIDVQQKQSLPPVSYSSNQPSNYLSTNLQQLPQQYPPQYPQQFSPQAQVHEQQRQGKGMPQTREMAEQFRKRQLHGQQQQPHQQRQNMQQPQQQHQQRQNMQQPQQLQQRERNGMVQTQEKAEQYRRRQQQAQQRQGPPPQPTRQHQPLLPRQHQQWQVPVLPQQHVRSPQFLEQQQPTTIQSLHLDHISQTLTKSTENPTQGQPLQQPVAGKSPNNPQTSPTPIQVPASSAKNINLVITANGPFLLTVPTVPQSNQRLVLPAPLNPSPITSPPLKHKLPSMVQGPTPQRNIPVYMPANPAKNASRALLIPQPPVPPQPVTGNNLNNLMPLISKETPNNVAAPNLKVREAIKPHDPPGVILMKKTNVLNQTNPSVSKNVNVNASQFDALNVSSIREEFREKEEQSKEISGKQGNMPEKPLDAAAPPQENCQMLDDLIPGRLDKCLIEDVTSFSKTFKKNEEKIHETLGSPISIASVSSDSIKNNVKLKLIQPKGSETVKPAPENTPYVKKKPGPRSKTDPEYMKSLAEKRNEERKKREASNPEKVMENVNSLRREESEKVERVKSPVKPPKKVRIVEPEKNISRSPDLFLPKEPQNIEKVNKPVKVVEKPEVRSALKEMSDESVKKSGDSAVVKEKPAEIKKPENYPLLSNLLNSAAAKEKPAEVKKPENSGPSAKIPDSAAAKGKPDEVRKPENTAPLAKVLDSVIAKEKSPAKTPADVIKTPSVAAKAEVVKKLTDIPVEKNKQDVKKPEAAKEKPVTPEPVKKPKNVPVEKDKREEVVKKPEASKENVTPENNSSDCDPERKSKLDQIRKYLAETTKEVNINRKRKSTDEESSKSSEDEFARRRKSRKPSSDSIVKNKNNERERISMNKNTAEKFLEQIQEKEENEEPKSAKIGLKRTKDSTEKRSKKSKKSDEESTDDSDIPKEQGEDVKPEVSDLGSIPSTSQSEDLYFSNVIKSMQSSESFRCLGCSKTISTNQCWINVKDGELKCMNCLIKIAAKGQCYVKEHEREITNLKNEIENLKAQKRKAEKDLKKLQDKKSSKVSSGPVGKLYKRIRNSKSVKIAHNQSSSEKDDDDDDDDDNDSDS